jgi:hypothetical protein
MWTWVQRASYLSNIGRVLWLIFGGSAVGGGLLLALAANWEFFKSAPLSFEITVVIALMVLFCAVAISIIVYLSLPPSAGVFSPRYLRIYSWPIWNLSWRFDNFLGGRSGDGSPVEATGFQAQFRINRGQGIHPKHAFIECKATGQKMDVLIECGNPYMRAEEIIFVPRGKSYSCNAEFRSERSGEQGVLKEEFLKKWSGFDFVFEYDDYVFRRHFSRQEIEDIFDRFWRYSNMRPEPRPLARSTS